MESTIDKLLEKFALDNGLYFELAAKNSEGEILASYTSTLEAKDVVGFADLLDEQIMKMALNDTESDDE